MSSAVVSTSAALGRPFVFDPKADSDACLPSDIHDAEGKYSPFVSPVARVQLALKNQSKIPPASIAPASQFHIRPAPEMVSSGAPAIDALTGGLPRGCLTEICGPASSGRTTLLLAALAAATRRGEFCAVVDASDALDPQSAAAAGMELDHLLWIRCSEDPPRKNSSPQGHPSTSLRAGSGAEKDSCEKNKPSAGCREVDSHARKKDSQITFGFSHTEAKKNALNEDISRQSDHRLEQVLRATDLLLESGGFGLIVLDLGDLPPQSARRIPLTTWFRFRRAVENKPTILLAIEQKPIAGSCSSLLVQLGDTSVADPGDIRPAHAQLLTGLNITAELIRSRLDRKPSRSVAFATKTAWAG